MVQAIHRARVPGPNYTYCKRAPAIGGVQMLESTYLGE